MKLEIESSVLKKELGKLRDIVSSRSTVPSLSNVLLEATENQELILKVTDLCTVVVIVCPCEVSEPGLASLSVAMFYKTLSNMNSDTVYLESEPNHWVKVKAGSSACRLAGTHPGDHPSLPTDEDLQYHPVSPELMLDLINKSVFCISSDDTKPAFCGGYFKYTFDRRLVMVATDGARLACVESESEEFAPVEGCQVPPELKNGSVLPEKGLKFLSRHIDPSAYDLLITSSEQDFFFKHGPMTVSMRIIKADFPNYREIAPRILQDPITINREEFIQAIKFLMPFTSDKTTRVDFTLDPDKDAALNLYAHDPAIGEGEKDVAAQYNPIDEKIKIQMNCKFVLEALQAIDGDTIHMTLVNNPNLPTLIKDANRKCLVYVIMPYR